jgi:hypothetical protein
VHDPAGSAGADIAAAELCDRFIHRYVLIHHLDAGLAGFLGERQDRGIAGMTHHGNALRGSGHGFTKLLHHFLGTPAGKNIIDLRAGILGSLDRAVIDD